MIVVIQCAARKKADAGHLRRADAKAVLFVADPTSAPQSDQHDYARPDDPSDTGETWREHLLSYNETPGNNPLGLVPACQLYENKTYVTLAERLGLGRLFILSAGWGLLAADFLTPAYDITFSNSAEKHKRRRMSDRYDDFCMLSQSASEPVVFFGGKDYVPLFCELTTNVRAERHVYYNSATPLEAPGCILKRFDTTTRTNWHYECANAFIERHIAS